MRRVLDLRERGSLALPALVGGLLVLGLIGGALLLTRSGPDEPEGAPAPLATPTSEDHSLTDAEAIARFKELDALRLRAIEKRDPQLADSIYVDGVAAEKQVLRDISKLKQTGTRVQTEFETTAIQVVHNAQDEVRLRQTVLVEAHFTDKRGNDLGIAQGRERQIIEWTLTAARQGWLIQDAIVVKARMLK